MGPGSSGLIPDPIPCPAMLIVTGFKPFRHHQVNPSWTVACAMAKALGIEAHLLDVTFEQAACFAAPTLAGLSEESALFVHLGLAASREKVSFEACARNLKGVSADNAGATAVAHQALVEEALDRRKTRLDLEAILRRYEALCPPELPSAEISHDCGDYVCNALYYHSLRACAARPDTMALFVHVPLMDSDTATALGEVLAKVVSFPT
jgi:pyroglutamyl-peptidase